MTHFPSFHHILFHHHHLHVHFKNAPEGQLLLKGAQDNTSHIRQKILLRFHWWMSPLAGRQPVASAVSTFIAPHPLFTYLITPWSVTEGCRQEPCGHLQNWWFSFSVKFRERRVLSFGFFGTGGSLVNLECLKGFWLLFFLLFTNVFWSHFGTWTMWVFSFFQLQWKPIKVHLII